MFTVKSTYYTTRGVVITHVAPTGTPLNLQNTTYDSSSVTIQWEDVECSQRNGEINSYNVTYYCNSGGSGTLYSKIVSNQMFTTTRLKFSTSYTFEVQALSSMPESGPPAYISVNTSSSQGEQIWLCDEILVVV